MPIMETTALSTLADILKKPSKPKSGQNSPEGDDPEGTNSRTTILDLDGTDRYRVLKLIEELLDAQEEADKLRQKLDEEKAEFREKKSALLKKVDALNEKHAKAMADVQNLKEKHSHSLGKLEEKISTVSNKFEASVAEIVELRKSNANLKQENTVLRKLHSESSTAVSIFQEENSRLSSQLEASKQKEKLLKRELKRLSQIGLDEEMLTTRPSSELQDESRHEGNLTGRSGAGDYTSHPFHTTFSASGVNTIKAPEKTFQSSDLSALAYPNGSKIMNSFVPSSSPIQNYTPVASTSSNNNEEAKFLEDKAILESLFFRF